MLQYMRTWVQQLPNQHSILSRLTRQAVRNHENIRRAGEGGAPEAQGTFAYNQGVQVQHNIQSYVQGIPIVGQATQMMGSFSGQGGRRELPPGAGDGPLMPNAPTYSTSPPPAPFRPQGDAGPHHGGHPHHQPTHSYSQSQGPPTGGYAPPPGPPSSGPSCPVCNEHITVPPGQDPNAHMDRHMSTECRAMTGQRHNSSGPPAPSFPGAHSGGYASPSGPPPSFPGAYGSYNPNYASSPPPGPPPHFPSAHGGFTPPPAGPGFPGPTPYGANAPPGPPPSFPGGPPPPQGGYPPYNQYGSGGGW